MAIAAVLLALLASVLFVGACWSFDAGEHNVGVVVGFLAFVALSTALVMSTLLETRPGGVFGPPVGVAGRK